MENWKNYSASPKKNGAALCFTVYGGSDAPHEWHCGNPDHPTWMADPWRVKKRGHRCPACAGNRRLDLDELRSWGESVGLELVDAEYHGTNYAYNWRCKQAQHPIRRFKGDIEDRSKKGYPACTTAAQATQ